MKRTNDSPKHLPMYRSLQALQQKLKPRRWQSPITWQKSAVGRLLQQMRRTMQIAGDLAQRVEQMQLALGRLELNALNLQEVHDINAANLKVFSQWGEDGILQWLIHHLPDVDPSFVEFGVADFSEANSRFLLMHNHWRGLVIDSSAASVERIRASALSWRYPLQAVHAFVTCENINDLLLKHGFKGELGVLSIDIDGNDYWVWQAIDCVNPAIVVIEYNHRFGSERRVTIPYQSTFQRFDAHSSGTYYGASLAALTHLGAHQGYDLVGCNLAGNNAFFVRSDLRPDWMQLQTAKAAFVQGNFREARGHDGKLLYLDAAKETALLDGLPLVEID